MITATVTDADVGFEFVLDEGDVAFVDADWLPALGRASVRALTVGLAETGDDRHPIEVARAKLAAAASSVVAYVLEQNKESDVASIHVPGRGAFATEVRSRLGVGETPSIGPSATPLVWVETSGDAAALHTALAGVADLGTVVLAAPARQPTIEIDLYRDIHHRGLCLHAVDLTVSEAASDAPAIPDPVPVASGQTVPMHWWYYLSA